MARLPKLSAQQPIVNPDRKPSSPFLQFMEATRSTQLATDERQDAADAAILQLISDLSDAVDAIAAAQAAADAAQAAASAAQADVDLLETELEDVVAPQVLSLTEGVQVAQFSANATQAEVDILSGSGSVSGSASNPAVDVPDGTWVLGPQVDLTGVVAGDLTITGSGPQQDSDLASTGTFNGQFRIVEVVGGVDTVLDTFGFTVSAGGTLGTVLYVSAVSDFIAARATTGAVSYRIDARRATGSASLTSLSLYIFARRAV